MCQSEVELSTHMGLYAYLLEQRPDGRLAYVDSLLADAWFRLTDILSADEALHNLGYVAFVSSALFSFYGQHTASVAEIICIVKRLEELHTEVQGNIKFPHIVTTIIYGMSMRWSMYLDRCMEESSSEDVGVPRETVSFSLEPILLDMWGGWCVGPLLLGFMI